jgi:plasmid stabilization system protein ParE
MKVVWSHRAKRDLHELVATIAEDSIQGAELVAGRILKAAKSLVRMPRGGHIGRVAGTRERVVEISLHPGVSDRFGVGQDSSRLSRGAKMAITNLVARPCGSAVSRVFHNWADAIR